MKFHAEPTLLSVTAAVVNDAGFPMILRMLMLNCYSK